MNKAIISGRVVQDPEIKELKGGVKVARIDLENVETFIDSMEQEREKTVFFRVEGWNAMAGWIQNEIRRNDEIIVEGSFGVDKFKVDGEPRIKYIVKAKKIEIIK